MDKSAIVLGPRTAFKKRFDRIYDFRSRFVHGDIDFSLEYRLDEESTERERFEDESIDAMLLAQAMLIATVQKLVELNQYELRFRYALESTRDQLIIRGWQGSKPNIELKLTRELVIAAASGPLLLPSLAAYLGRYTSTGHLPDLRPFFNVHP